ncbi:MAG TPA: NAD(P)-dependent oxidoreductase [Aeromicrobium sp.]|nr:NAD(P)-dependent oxidoreductase [Aeromicrobium sp.]
MTRVCITGANGFIGRTLARSFRERGAEVVGVDRDADPAAGVVAGDISQPGEWQRVADGCTTVVHTAALVGMPSDESSFWDVNVRGTRLALDAARDGGAERFVHISSVVTFGLDFPDGVDESWPVRTTGVAYVDTKVAAEQVVLQAHAAGQIDVTVIRPGDVYGPGSRPWTTLPLELLRARRFALPEHGRGIHSPVYVDDLVDGVVMAAECGPAAGRVINLSGGAGVETSEFFDYYARMLGRRRVPTVPTSVALAAAALQSRIARARGTVSELTPDGVRFLALRRGTYGIATARDLLAWEPRVGLAEGMSRTEAWARAQGLLERS